MLKVGDRIKITGVPTGQLHPETTAVYEKIIARNRSVRINQVIDGVPWIECRFRTEDGKIQYECLAITENDQYKFVRSRNVSFLSSSQVKQ